MKSDILTYTGSERRNLWQPYAPIKRVLNLCIYISAVIYCGSGLRFGEVWEACQLTLTELKQTRNVKSTQTWYETLLPENLGRHCRKWPKRQSRFRDQASHSRKQQAAGSHSLHWWLSHQRPTRVTGASLLSTGCDNHPRRQCSLWGLNPQLDNGNERSLHTCYPLDCLERWQTVRPHNCHHSHRFNNPATKSEKWNGKPRLACVNVLHPPLASKNPVGVLSWTCQSQRKWQRR